MRDRTLRQPDAERVERFDEEVPRPRPYEWHCVVCGKLTRDPSQLCSMTCEEQAKDWK